jgi:cytochrome c biogenesis protein CcdA
MKPAESTADLASDLVEEARQLVRLEIELAKQELKEMAITNGIAAGSFVVAGLLVVFAVFAGIPVLIVAAVPWHWQAALVWILVYVLLAVGLYFLGRSRLRIEPPPRTVQSIKETWEWALRRLSWKSG